MQQLHAYLDAGSASMLVQLLLGGIASIAVGLKLYWGRLMKLLHIRKTDADPEPAERAPAAVKPTPVSAPNPAERAFGETQSR
jgi:hypothetical protein